MKKLFLTCALGGAMALSAKAGLRFTLDTAGLNSNMVGPGDFQLYYDVEVFDDAAFSSGEYVAALPDIPGFHTGTSFFYDDGGSGADFSVVEGLDSTYAPGNNASLYDLELGYIGAPQDPSGYTSSSPLHLGYLVLNGDYDYAGPTSSVTSTWFWYDYDPEDALALEGTNTALVPIGGENGGGEVPEASTVVSTAFMGLAGAAYVIRRRRAQAIKA